MKTVYHASGTPLFQLAPQNIMQDKWVYLNQQPYGFIEGGWLYALDGSVIGFFAGGN